MADKYGQTQALESFQYIKGIAMLILIVFFFSGRAFAVEPPGISEIRNLYMRAGTLISLEESIPVSLSFGSNPDNSIALYGDPATFAIAKVIKTEFTEYYSTYTEYLFFPSGDLAFIYERTVLPQNRRKEEHRYYIFNGKLIRYIHDVDSDRTIYDEGLENWITDLNHLAGDAGVLGDFYNDFIGPMLAAAGNARESIFLGMRKNEVSYSESNIIVFIRTDNLMWGIKSMDVWGYGDEFVRQGNNSHEFDYSFTGGFGCTYSLNYSPEEGMVNYDYLLHDYEGPPPYEKIFSVLNFAIDTDIPVRFNAAPFEETDDVYLAGLTSRKEVRLPVIALSRSAPAFSNKDAQDTASAGRRVEAEYAERKVFTPEDLELMTLVSDPSKSRHVAGIITRGTRQRVLIMREVPELTRIEGHSLAEIGYDIYPVELNILCSGTIHLVKRIEWLSPNEILIVFSCDGEEVTVTAVMVE